MKPHEARRLFIVLVFFTTLSGVAYGLTVSVAPAQDSAFAPAPRGSGSPVGFLVDGCMSALFNAGHIATDEPPSLVKREDWGLRDYGLDDAKAGFVDYVIALFVKWAPSTIHKDAILPAAIDYRLVRVSDGKILAEGSVPGSADTEDTSSHASMTASKAGSMACAACIEKLRTLAKGGES